MICGALSGQQDYADILTVTAMILATKGKNIFLPAGKALQKPVPENHVRVVRELKRQPMVKMSCKTLLILNGGEKTRWRKIPPPPGGGRGGGGGGFGALAIFFKSFFLIQTPPAPSNPLMVLGGEAGDISEFVPGA